MTEMPQKPLKSFYAKAELIFALILISQLFYLLGYEINPIIRLVTTPLLAFLIGYFIYTDVKHSKKNIIPVVIITSAVLILFIILPIQKYGQVFSFLSVGVAISMFYSIALRILAYSIDKGTVDCNYNSTKKKLDLFLILPFTKRYRPYALYRRGLFSLNQKNLGEARKIHRKLLTHYPNYEWTYFFEGQILSNENKLSEAIDAYSKAIELNPKLYKTYISRGCTHSCLKNTEEAISDAKEAIKLNPSDPDGYILLISMLKQSGRSNEAYDEIQRAFYVVGNDYRLFSLRARLYIDTEDYASACKDLLTAEKLGADTDDIYFHLGYCLTFLGDTDKAIDYYSKALEKSPVHQFARLNRADLYAKNGSEEKFLEEYERLRELYPKFIEPDYRTGIHFFNKNDLVKAEEYFNRALDIDPDHLSSLQYRGCIRQKLSKLPGAQKDFEHALKVAPKDHYSMNELANVILDTEAHFQRALELAESAILLSENTPDYWDTKGDIFLKLDKKIEALSSFHKALSLIPEEEKKGDEKEFVIELEEKIKTIKCDLA
ncbi:TPR Domain containing protein [Chitinispirillum alkaliphilum]|nr:TPR Domain containing protein [Chitinispirillum alkaliphilum]